MCSGSSHGHVDDHPVLSLACARFPTIHKPNYYFHWLNNEHGTSSGESEKQ